MRLLLAAACLFVFSTTVRAQDDDEIPAVQRYLVGLRLGDSMDDVRRIYPPAVEWPSTQERGGVTRYRVDRDAAKYFPRDAQTLYLGIRHGHLSEIEVIYDESRSRKKPVEALAGDYALVYGEARRSGERFWWSDRRTVLRIFPAELPAAKRGKNAVMWRTAMQIFDAGFARRGE